MKHFIVLLLLFISFSVWADQCVIKMPDLKKVIESVNKADVLEISDLTDQNSDEPVRRYVQVLSSGEVMMIEQKHCSMYNLTITLLLPDTATRSTASHRLSDILVKMPVWKKWFNKLNPKDILKAELNSTRFKSHQEEARSFEYALDNKISAEAEDSEVLLSYANLDPYSLPFRTIFSIYIGVGGM
jgi:hypothetical protein